MRVRAITLSAAASVVASTAMALPVSGADYKAGVRQFKVASPERGKNLDVTVWYPASSGGQSIELGGSIFFEGTYALHQADHSEGPFPLILLSHGAGLAGRAEAMSWIATPLAKRGFVVVAPTHPGNTGPDRSAEETMKLWQRPADLSVTLDSLQQDAALKGYIDFDKVGVLGLSMGGNTALLLAGVALDPDLLAQYCDTPDENASLCAWVRMSGVDLHAMDKSVVGRDNTDPRVQFAMAIDPAPADVFATGTFADVSTPVTVVNLGRVEAVPATLQAKTIAQAIPGAGYLVVEDANHFSMFAECKPGAAETAADEGIEDAICEDGTLPRSAIHTILVDLVAAQLERALKSED